MATLKKYSLFINDKTGQLVKESTHKWVGLARAGFRFATDEEDNKAREEGVHPDQKNKPDVVEKTKETPTPVKKLVKINPLRNNSRGRRINIYAVNYVRNSY